MSSIRPAPTDLGPNPPRRRFLSRAALGAAAALGARSAGANGPPPSPPVDDAIRAAVRRLEDARLRVAEDDAEQAAFEDAHPCPGEPGGTRENLAAVWRRQEQVHDPIVGELVDAERAFCALMGSRGLMGAAVDGRLYLAAGLLADYEDAQGFALGRFAGLGGGR